MAANPYDIIGFPSTYKRPIMAVKLETAQGPRSANDGPMRTLVLAQKISGGSLTEDDTPVQLISENDADAKYGVGSLGALMARAQMALGAVVLATAIAAPTSSPSAATTTSVITGTWSAAGDVTFIIDGTTVTCTVGGSDNIDVAGAAIAAKVNTYPQLPVSAGYNTGTDTLTLTHKTIGAIGVQQIVELDLSAAPAGFAMTLVGSASVSGGTRVRMGASSTGVGVLDVTTALTKLAGTEYERIALLPNDATNAALVEAYLNDKEQPLSKLYEQAIVGVSGSSSAAVSLAQSTLNTKTVQVLAFRNAVRHPSVMAAGWAGVRGATEADNPVWDNDGIVIPLMAPQAYRSDYWTAIEEELLLNAGVTPVRTENGEARVVRSITTYCLNGSTQDDRCIDTNDITMAQYAAKATIALYADFRAVNPVVRDDPEDGEDDPPEGVQTPKRWQGELESMQAEWVKNLWIEPPTENARPRVTFNRAATRLQGLNAFVVQRIAHQAGMIIRQQAAAR